MVLKKTNIKQIFIFGYYGAGNIGDELILDGLLSFLPSGYQALVCGRQPHYLRAEHRVKAVGLSIFNLGRIIFEIYRSDRVIIGGGDLLQELTSRRSLRAVYFIYRAAKFFKKHLCFLGISAGPIASKSGRQMAAEMIGGADLIITRGHQTYNFLKKLTGEKPNFFESVDLAFASKTYIKPAATEFSRDFPGQKIIVLTVRDWFGDADKLKTVSTLAGILDRLAKTRQIKFVFLPFQFDRDKKIEVAILNNLPGRKHFISFNRPLTIPAMWAALKGADAVIGMRLHSLVMAAILGQPFFSLSYSPKNSEFMEEFGLGDYQLPVTVFDSGAAVMFEKFLDDEEKIQKIIEMKIGDFYQKVQAAKALFQQEFFK